MFANPFKGLKKSLTFIAMIVLLIGLSTGESFGIPNLQVWSPDWDYVGDSGSDEDTWFVYGTTFALWVIGAGAHTTQITDLMLIVSVPDGTTGTITGLGDGDFYTTKSLFLPTDLDTPLNNHYPFQDGVSDFWVYEIGEFTGAKTLVARDYDASTGTIGPESLGWRMEFDVSYTGYPWIHFDVIGYVTTQKDRGPRNPPLIESFWDINPGSHDVSVPEPSTVLLLGAGLVGFALLLRRKRIK